MIRKKIKKIIVAVLVLALTLVYGIAPEVSEAASFESISDTISNSDLSASGVTHTIVASTTVELQNGEYIEFVFPASFTGVAEGNLTCPGSGVASTTSGGNSVGCVYASGLVATSAVFTLTGVTNPSTAGGYKIRVYTREDAATTNAEIENGTAMVAIVDEVVVTATVDAILTFQIIGMSSSTATDNLVNGVALTSSGSSTYNTIPFGVLDVNSSSTIAQGLQVTTNAFYGYTVTVQQDQDLTANNGADIDAFVEGTAATTAQAWQSPAGTIAGGENTYGHFGFTSEDQNLSGGDDFGASLYQGFDGTTPVEVMYNNGPADGATDDVGYTEVAYTIEISALQEAGDYTNTLTYICTPTY